MNLLNTLSKIGIIYFIIFSIIYLVKFMEAFLLFEKYHSTSIGIDIAQTITGSSPVFTALALLAILSAGIWIYQTVRGEQSATVS
jgi:hypothetical protein